MMVGQWASEHRPDTYVNVLAMDNREQLASDRQQSSSVEMSPRHADDDVQPTTSTTTSDVAYQSLLTSESDQSSTISHELDRNWIENPSFAIVYSPTTVQCSVVVQTPPLLSSASMKHNGGTGSPRRILPLTKYSENWRSFDVTETSTASATGASPSHTLPHDVKEWFPHTGKEPAVVLTSADALNFAKSLEAETLKVSLGSFISDFPRDVSTSTASDVSVKLSTTFEATQSTIALQDVYNLGLMVEGSSGFSAAQQSDPAELESIGSQSYLQSHPSADPFHVTGIPVFQESALPSSTPELEATTSHGSPSHLFHAQRMHGVQSVGSSSGSEPELVTPLLSLSIGSDVPAGMRDPVEHTARSSRSSPVRTRTHPECSTLFYHRRHNPGLHRPRTYRCDEPGQSVII